jgi:NAD(P)-dependent dehydrogenase (short-subunit alcohol dehydrogenase family)
VDFGLLGKVALVIGAGGQSGFGKAIALTLVKEGCDLIITYNKNAEGAGKTVDYKKNLGRDAIAVKVDVRSGREVDNLIKVALEHFNKVDILVNNAGGPTSLPAPFIESNPSNWDMDIELNLNGTLHCSKAVLHHMISRKQGKIINISSMSARTGGKDVCVYESAKASVIAFTKGLALEVASLGINVNCVAPGFGLTELGRNVSEEILNSMLKTIPLKRTTTPEDVAYAVAYFASDVSADVTGQTLAVDGGTTMY